MKAVILAGGLGARISEETHLKPKPMVEIGNRPILWHIMKIYSHFGINDFIICCGYKGYVIKEYFANYYLHMSDITFDMEHNKMQVHANKAENWRVTLVDTGEDTMTGGRLKRAASFIDRDENFCFTYGDGLADINIRKLIEFHLRHGKQATLTAVRPPGRYGALVTESGMVTSFQEKPEGDGNWVNGGFFVLSPKVISRIVDDNTHWESKPLESLARDNELAAFKHNGFWRSMDTLRDKNNLESLWKSENPPWKLWE